LIRRLGGVVPERKTFVVDAEIERSEELRVDRLGPTEDDLADDDPEWTPPPDAWRPESTLSHVRPLR
jgi:hypothetical protein